jgi:hypothetical protein
MNEFSFFTLFVGLTEHAAENAVGNLARSRCGHRM